jgi:hypothetical protein
MSLKIVNDPKLIPDSIATEADKNINSAKLLLPVYPREGNANFGYTSPAAQQIMTFEVGSQNSAWLGAESYISFDLKLAVGTTGAVLAGNSSCLFSRIRVMNQSGVVLYDEQELALNSWITDINTLDDSQKSCRWESMCDQLNISDSASTKITSSAVHIVMPLPGRIWSQVEAFHLPVTGNLRVELTMARDNQAFSLFVTNGDAYRIDNPVLSAAMLPMKMEFQDQVAKLAMQGGYLLNYSQDYFYRAPCVGSNNTVTVPFGAKSVRAIRGITKLNSEDNTYNLSYLKGVSPLGGLVSLQARIGSEQYPSSAINKVEEVYTECKKLYKLYRDIDAGNQITRANFTQAVNTSTDQKLSSKFNFGIDLSRNGMNTGASTVNGSATVQYQVGTATAGTDIMLFLTYDTMALIRSPVDAVVEY